MFGKNNDDQTTYNSQKIAQMNTFRSGLYCPELVDNPRDDLGDFEEFKLQFNDQDDKYNAM